MAEDPNAADGDRIGEDPGTGQGTAAWDQVAARFAELGTTIRERYAAARAARATEAGQAPGPEAGQPAGSATGRAGGRTLPRVATHSRNAPSTR